MDDSALRHASLRFVPSRAFIFTSLLSNSVAAFLNGFSCAGTRKAQDGVRLQPVSAREQCAHDLKFM
jgi:hypothetical protein